MSEQEKAREAARSEWGARPALEPPGISVAMVEHAFEFGFNAGADWQAKQDRDRMELDRHLAQESAVAAIVDDDLPLRAALAACVAALEVTVAGNGHTLGCQCGAVHCVTRHDAIAQARAALA